ncbi:MAG: Polysaccharide export protein, partial [Pedosphaera sp.]|nr:Polysaccharide export protein [Pedosphaera sp.]
SLQAEVAKSATNTAAIGYGGATGFASVAGGPVVDPVYDIIRAKITAMENSRQLLADRQREALAFAANPPGNVKLYSYATEKSLNPDKRWLKISLATVFGGIFGIVFAAGSVLLVEIMDDRLKTAADVKRVTRLPVLAALDNLKNKGPSAREKWAFRTWTMLQGRLSPSPNHGLVCGITSSKEGEGRSTWIHMLAEAASMSGFRVLTIATRPSAPAPENKKVDALIEGEKQPEQSKANGEAQPDGETEENSIMELNGESRALTGNALTSPAEVTDQLTGPNPQPMVHIPLPGWVWNLERRKQWQEAISQWRQIDNLVILVELPPASQSEAVLLGGNLPNLLWLTDSGVADAAETRTQLETLRNARCNLIGAVLNHEPAPPLKSRFPRWLGCLMLCVGFGMISANAAETNTAAPAIVVAQTGTNASPILNTNASFALMNPASRGEWQKRLTLGPGDMLSFTLYGQPELARADIFVGPDGRVSFLEAQNVLAMGLTVDELRTNIDNELGKFRRAPRTIITPVAYQSKKYYMLGKIVQRGVYTLDRPLTIVEAVARAHGLETGLSDRNTIDLADFQRSFLMRKGQRIPINFEKLFTQGDLSQNIAIEPDDYLFFPATTLQEVYVLGEVRLPGIVPFTSAMTVVGAISTRGGFTDRAYKSHVVVIRGSINNPQPFVVDTKAILDARGQDFKLQARDIIYVSSRPFIRAEDLLDLAATAFVQSIAAEWAGVNIGPFISTPLIPNL